MNNLLDKDPEEKMTELTESIHSLFRGYVNGMHSHKQMHLSLEEKLNIIREYCDPFLKYKWAATIAGIIDDCDFRDVKE